MPVRALLLALLLFGWGLARAMAGTAEARIRVTTPPGARTFYSLPGTPVVHPVAGLAALPVPADCRGPYTFWAMAPGCFPAYRHYDRAALVRAAAKPISLTPIPSRSVAPETLVGATKRCAFPKETPDEQCWTSLRMWSPDGRGLAFARLLLDHDPIRDRWRQDAQIWWCPKPPGKAVLVERQTRTGERVGAVYTSNLAFSPDGEWLAYSIQTEPGAPPRLFIKSLFTGERRPVAAGPRLAGDYPAWSPDGASLAYLRKELKPGPPSELPDQGPATLVVARWDGKAPRTLATDVADVTPSFSPDGRQIAYAAKDALMLCDRATGSTRAVGPAPDEKEDAHRAFWSPDGEWIAFLTVEGFVTLVHRSGSPMRRLTRCNTTPAWLPDGRLILTGARGWVPGKGAFRCGLILASDGALVRRFGARPIAPSPDGMPGEPWENPDLPILPTLPGAATLVREGSAW